MLPYGNSDLSFRLPSGWRLLSILAPQGSDPIREPDAALERSLRNPVGCPGLAEQASRRDHAIITDDKTRPTPIGRLISTILEELEGARRS